VKWRNPKTTRKGPYWLVSMDGTKASTEVKYLTAPGAAECTDCHRIGSSASCNRFSPDAMGIKPDDRPFQAALRGDGMAGSNFPMGFWMPEGHNATTYALWNDAFGAARDTITKCCELGPDAEDPACTWEDIPHLDQNLPLLIIRGETSDTLSADSAGRLREMLPRATHVTMPGAGHLFPQSHPAETRAILEQWLAGLR
jgi:pimeloyl-ACP methyl ester carboxylesterase